MGEIQHNEKGSVFLKRTKRIAWLLDSSIKIPGTRYSFGIDALVGIFPLLGDIIGMFMSFYLVLTIVIHGASGKVIVKMILNTIFDALLGAIPFLGVFFDAAFKANERNYNLLLTHYEKGSNRGSGLGVIITWITLILVVFMLISFILYLLLKRLYAQWLGIGS